MIDATQPKTLPMSLQKTKSEFNAAIYKAKEPVEPKAKAVIPAQKDWTASGLANADKASTAGTFARLALHRWAAGSVMQKIADATQRTADATEEIADNTSGGGAGVWRIAMANTYTVSRRDGLPENRRRL